MNTPASQIATPFQEPTSAATDLQALQFVIKQVLNSVRTATLVEVKAVTPPSGGDPGTVDVLPLVNQVDGAGNIIPQVTLYARPYLRVFGGSNAFVCDPQEGDIGLMVFSDRDLSSVITSLGPSPPASRRRFSFADGLYLFGMPTETPDNFVEIATNGAINIVTASEDVTINGVTVTPAGTLHAPVLEAGNGASGTFTTNDGKTVTVVDGIVTMIV